MKKQMILTAFLIPVLFQGIFAQDVPVKLDGALSSYQAENLENTRFLLQEALNGIIEMAQAVLAWTANVDDDADEEDDDRDEGLHERGPARPRAHHPCRSWRCHGCAPSAFPGA